MTLFISVMKVKREEGKRRFENKIMEEHIVIIVFFCPNSFMYLCFDPNLFESIRGMSRCDISSICQRNV